MRMAAFLPALKQGAEVMKGARASVKSLPGFDSIDPSALPKGVRITDSARKFFSLSSRIIYAAVSKGGQGRFEPKAFEVLISIH